MSAEDFRNCARQTFGDVVDAWDEVVLQPLATAGRWFKSLDGTIQWMFGGILSAGGASAVALLAKAVGVGAAEVVLPVIVAFAAGVGIGTGLIILGECADQL